jgi:hypothetical protein
MTWGASALAEGNLVSVDLILLIPTGGLLIAIGRCKNGNPPGVGSCLTVSPLP